MSRTCTLWSRLLFLLSRLDFSFDSALLSLPGHTDLLSLGRTDRTACLRAIFDPSARIVQLCDCLAADRTGESDFAHLYHAGVGHLLGCSSHCHAHVRDGALLVYAGQIWQTRWVIGRMLFLLMVPLVLYELCQKRTRGDGFGVSLTQDLHMNRASAFG